MKIGALHTVIRLAVLIGLSSCKDQPKTLREYKSWFSNPDHGYVCTKQINGLQFKVQHRPVDLQMLNEIEASRSYTKKEVEHIRASYGNSEYFLLEISHDKTEESAEMMNAQTYGQYAEKFKTLSSGLGEYVELQTESSTNAPQLYHYEPSYELGQKIRVLFAFPHVKDGEAMTFVYNDLLFSTTKLKFKFENDQGSYPELPITYISE